MTEFHGFKRIFPKGRIYVEAPDAPSAFYRLGELGYISFKESKNLVILKQDVSVPDGKCQNCRKMTSREAIYFLNRKRPSFLCESCKQKTIGIGDGKIGINF